MHALALVLLTLGQVTAPQATYPEPPAEKPKPLPQGVVEIEVEDLHCKSCAKRLARKLYATPGVKRVRTYVAKDLAVVELQAKKPVEMAALWRAAERAEQKPLVLRVLDQRLVAKDFAEAREETAQAVGVRGAPR